MRKIFLLLVLIFGLGLNLMAQGAGETEDPKAELRERLNYAHEMVFRYLYHYTRDTGTDRHYHAYLYWLNERQEIAKQLAGHQD